MSHARETRATGSRKWTRGSPWLGRTEQAQQSLIRIRSCGFVTRLRSSWGEGEGRHNGEDMLRDSQARILYHCFMLGRAEGRAGAQQYSQQPQEGVKNPKVLHLKSPRRLLSEDSTSPGLVAQRRRGKRLPNQNMCKIFTTLSGSRPAGPKEGRRTDLLFPEVRR